MGERASKNVYRFTVLKKGAAPDLLKALVTLAVKETELVFGRARRKLETSCEVSPKRLVCRLEGGTECGEHLARLVSGFLIKQLGEEGFRVERLSRSRMR